MVKSEAILDFVTFLLKETAFETEMSDHDVENRPPMMEDGKIPRPSAGRRSLEELMADYRRILSPNTSGNVQEPKVSKIQRPSLLPYMSSGCIIKRASDRLKPARYVFSYENIKGASGYLTS